MQYEPAGPHKAIHATVALDIAYTGLLEVLTRHQPDLCADLAMHLQARSFRLPAHFDEQDRQGTADLLHAWEKILTGPPNPEVES